MDRNRINFQNNIFSTGINSTNGFYTRIFFALLLVIFFIIGFSFTTPTYAASMGACITQGGDEPKNSFTCGVADGENWMPQDGCSEGFEIDLSVCSGKYPGTRVCGDGNICCVACRSTTETNEVIPWGGECNADNKLCENGTSCYCEGDPNCLDPENKGICIKAPRTLSLNQSCKANIECNADENPTFGILICRPRITGMEPRCLYKDRIYCSTDNQCKVSLKDPDAVCNIHGLCEGDPPDLIIGEGPPPTDLCKQAGPLKDECEDCMGTMEKPKNFVWTSVGCIPTNIVSNDENGGMINAIFRIGLGVAGGFALIFILFGAFTITTSAGNPEKVQNGKEIVTAAIIGLVFIILSSVILRFIGVSILQIPGF